MVRKHQKIEKDENGVWQSFLVDYTPEEEAAADEAQAKWEADNTRENQIRRRLAELDVIYPRDDEDRDALLGFTPYSGSTRQSPLVEIKAEKDALRAELKGLVA